MEYQKIVQEIKEHKRNLGQNAWLLGRRLTEVKESKIYLENYGTFEEFLEKEVDMDRSSAYSYMGVSNRFDREFLSEWGIAKCRLLTSVEEPIREKVLEIHKPRDSFTELKQTTQRLKYKKPTETNVDFFVTTEELGIQVNEQLSNFLTHYRTCPKKKGWSDYLRREVITKQREKLTKQLEE